MPLLFLHSAFQPQALRCNQKSRHQEDPQFNSSCAAGQRLNADNPGTQPFSAGCMRPPELCSTNRYRIISARVTTFLLYFLPPASLPPPHSWKQEPERSHTLARLAPHLQQPATEGVTAHLCHHQFLRNIPMGKAPEQMQFSVWCLNHRNKACALLPITLAFQCTWGEKKKYSPSWSKRQF